MQDNRSNIAATKSEKEIDYMEIITHMLNKKKGTPPPEDLSVGKLYETMNMVVSGLDDSIRDCKKYNQAKIHRKYQIMIADLQQRIRFLEEKVRQEHKARSPSKRYVEDLLDKLIKFKFQNQTLEANVNRLKKQNEELQAKVKIYQEGDHNTQKKGETEKNNYNTLNNKGGNSQKHLTQGLNQEEQDNRIEITGAVLKNQVTTFMKLKQNLRRHQKQQKTSFERFLKKSQDRLENWTMRQFLTAVEKWTLEFYEQGTRILSQPRVNKQTKGQSRATKEQIRMKPTANSFRLRNKKSLLNQNPPKTALGNEYFPKNLTMYETILR